MSETNLPAVELTTKNTVALVLGITSTVIGVIALLIGWVPFLGLLAMPGAVIGLILAVVGGIVAIAKKGKGIGLPILGGIICACALVLPILSTGGVSAAIANASKKQAQDAKVTVVPKADNAASPAAATPQAASPAPEPPKVVWNAAANALRLGDVQVQIKGVKVRKIAVKDFMGGDQESSDDLLAITVEVSNLSAGKKIDFATWRGEHMSFDRTYASLTDDNENTYKRIDFGATTKIVGGVDNESIYPGQAITDVLVFEKPVAAAKWLHLELPAKNFNGEGVLRFEIPAGMISR
jgi:O-acetyl-ADP-ribose deacetylase (regulator of RNase III)